MRALVHSSVRAFNFPLFPQHGAILHQLLQQQHNPQNLQAAAKGPVYQKRCEISTAHFKPPARAKPKQAPASRCWWQSRAHTTAQKRSMKEHASSATLHATESRPQAHSSSCCGGCWVCIPTLQKQGCLPAVTLTLICQQELLGRMLTNPTASTCKVSGCWKQPFNLCFARLCTENVHLPQHLQWKSGSYHLVLVAIFCIITQKNHPKTIKPQNQTKTKPKNTTCYVYVWASLFLCFQNIS